MGLIRDRDGILCEACGWTSLKELDTKKCPDCGRDVIEYVEISWLNGKRLQFRVWRHRELLDKLFEMAGDKEFLERLERRLKREVLDSAETER